MTLAHSGPDVTTHDNVYSFSSLSHTILDKDTISKMYLTKVKPPTKITDFISISTNCSWHCDNLVSESDVPNRQ